MSPTIEQISAFMHGFQNKSDGRWMIMTNMDEVTSSMDDLALNLLFMRAKTNKSTAARKNTEKQMCRDLLEPYIYVWLYLNF